MIELAQNYIKSFNISDIDPYWRSYYQNMMGLVGAGTTQVISKCVKFMLPKFCYLEVGIYQAANFVGVAKNNRNKKCHGVDNFSQVFVENQRFNVSTKDVVLSRIEKESLENCTVHEDDFRSFLLNAKSSGMVDVGVYMYDGPHEYQDQVDGVEMALPLLADEAIIFVDDWASENVQEASKTLLKNNKELTLLRVLSGPVNNRDYFNQGQAVYAFKRER